MYENLEVVIGDIDAAIEERIDNEVLGEVDRSAFIPRNEEQLDWTLRKIQDAEAKILLLNDAKKRRINAIAEEFDARIAEIALSITDMRDLIIEGLKELDVNGMKAPAGEAYFQVRKTLVYPDKKENPAEYAKLIELGIKCGVAPRLELNKEEFKKHVQIVEPKPGEFAAFVDGKKTKLLAVEPKKSLVVKPAKPAGE